jgi:hypothetical protein
MLEADDGAGDGLAGAGGVSARRGLVARLSVGNLSGGSTTERGALSDEEGRDAFAGTPRASGEGKERGASGPGEGSCRLGTTVVVTVAVGNGPLVPMVGEGDSRCANGSLRAVPRVVAIDEDLRGCGAAPGDRPAGCAGGAGDSAAINTATMTNPTTSAATLYNARLAIDIVRRTGGAT